MACLTTRGARHGPRSTLFERSPAGLGCHSCLSRRVETDNLLSVIARTILSARSALRQRHRVWLAWRCCAGARRFGSSGTTSHPVSRPRMPSSRASMPPARRSAQQGAIHLPRPSPSRAARVEGRLQSCSGAQRAGQSHTDRICRLQRSRTATGRSAALHDGPRVPPRCSTEPCGLKCTWDSPHCRMSRGAQTITCAAPFPPWGRYGDFYDVTLRTAVSARKAQATARIRLWAFFAAVRSASRCFDVAVQQRIQQHRTRYRVVLILEHDTMG